MTEAEPSQTIVTLVRDAATHFPTNRFIVTPERAVTFAEANDRSRRLAKHLLALGVGKAARVGLLFPQGPDFVVALLAVTRIGALAVPFSTFLREPEVLRQLRFADVDTLLVAEQVAGRPTPPFLEATLPGLADAGIDRGPLLLTEAPHLRRIWQVGGEAARWAVSSTSLDALLDHPAVSDELLLAVEDEVHPSDVMVMVHTSGATAEPKAVVHTQESLVGHSRTIAALHGIDASTLTLTNMPFFWVGGLVVSVLSHLHAGATVITVERIDGPTIVELIDRIKPTRVVGWGLVERLIADPAVDDEVIAALRSRQLPNVQHPGRRHGSLGMTETGGPHSAVAVADNQLELPAQLQGSFGAPVAGVEHKIIDPVTGTAMPDGEHGEICVRGAFVMDALYKRRRADTFDADGWYRTGDGGYLRDGFLFFTGRLTDAIKTAGANVSPREVEQAVEALPQVAAAHVVGVPDDARGEIVGCVVCPVPGAELDRGALLEHLRTQLSSYKVPRRLVVLPTGQVPRLGSGKVDTAALRKLLGDAPS